MIAMKIGRNDPCPCGSGKNGRSAVVLVRIPPQLHGGRRAWRKEYHAGDDREAHQSIQDEPFRIVQGSIGISGLAQGAHAVGGSGHCYKMIKLSELKETFKAYF